MMSKSNDWRFCISVRIFKTVILEDIGKTVVRTIPKEEMFERLSAQTLIEP
jgi:uncharacterized FlaG/YvyC family protein